MKSSHPLLERQIRRYIGDKKTIPSELISFIEAVNEAYIQNDTDRAMVERSLELSSQELLQANAEMRGVFQALPDQYFRIDSEGRILDYKAPHLEIDDFADASRIGMRLQDFLHIDAWKRLRENVEHVIRTQSILTLSFPIKQRDEIYLYEARLVPIFKKQVIIVLRDVTEQEKAITALKEREERFSALIQQSTNSFTIVDAYGRLIYVSPSTEKILGYSLEELIGESAFNYIHPDDRDYVYQDFMKIVKGVRINKPVLEYRVLRGNGSWCCLESTASNLLDHPGINGIVITSRDITPQKEAEREKERLRSQIIQAQKMEAVGTLAGGIAHDFNNLLMGIQGYVSIALYEMDAATPTHERLVNIENLVIKGAELTKQLLGLSRGGQCEVKATQINELITGTVDIFGRTKKEIAIEINLLEDLWTADVDRGQIEQVLLNLFINAWQAMPGGGDLYLKTENVEIDDQTAMTNAVKAGSYIKLSVIDTGIGMDEATKERIFEPFFTTKDTELGTGLGLASVYGIIKNHNGFIDVESTPGRGTTFMVYLPASHREIADEKKPEDHLLSGHGTILFVDDEQTNLMIMKDLLMVMGYKVLLAASGQEAVAVYMTKQKQIDLIIMDMPGLGGGEAFTALRNFDPDVKVILCSGYSLDGEAEKIMAKGCNGFIQKPFTIEALSQKIGEVLHRAGKDSAVKV
ncbi:MAG: Sensor histidine kinase RcsC [Syntrophus sp. SKADARSKE-3]|nr:Sensor histidine kinase RcsC [Syntrophus sp. SKADARSKE-3]